MIKVFFRGNLTTDAELSSTANCCHINVAAKSSRMVDGKPKPVFFRATVWGKRAETCANYLKKGDAVCISGDFDPQEYKSREGETRIAFNVNNADVEFSGKPQSRSQPSAAPQQNEFIEVDEEELPF